MKNFGKWIKDRFGKDPMKVSTDEIKRDQLKIDRLASIKRDEIEDANSKILKTIQKGKGQSRETKINLAVELDVSKKNKMQLQKAHESLMNQKKALNMLEFMAAQKSTKQVSTIANSIFGMDVDHVSNIASEFAIEGMMEQDKLKELEGAMVGIFGEEHVSDETKQALEMWDELEAGEMDEDEFFKEIEKSTDKMVVKREEEA
ncbi:MAG: hypothetical protein GIS02_00190 [Methanosarcinales archaeon]|uniref:Uncharacterized protein n=1 Tax=Candidatus Ethanoperedens thermophilum TaxID=2766897 RepID=A0A848D6J1_9EURY|nr:hypothetical protein [Candidatus Ethanoperedens thermophilum]